MVVICKVSQHLDVMC